MKPTRHMGKPRPAVEVPAQGSRGRLGKSGLVGATPAPAFGTPAVSWRSYPHRRGNFGVNDRAWTWDLGMGMPD